MADKKTDAEGKLVNTTMTELDILKKIEKAFYDKNPETRKRNTERSMKWFKDYITKNWQHVRTSQMMRDRKMWKQTVEVGKMYFYEYDPKWKEILPVYDRYPLGFVVNKWTNNGVNYFNMIQLHYLPPALRLVVMRSLLKIRSENRYRQSTKLKISWEILKGLSNHKLFEHCIKTYRFDHVKTVFMEVPAASWEIVISLPLARFQKGGKSVAWNIK
jgi:hypothetical protein